MRYLSALSFLFLFPLGARADEGVDLTQMGMDDFAPYLFDRNRLWILLPLFSLLLVALHLKQKPKPRRVLERPGKPLERPK